MIAPLRLGSHPRHTDSSCPTGTAKSAGSLPTSAGTANSYSTACFDPQFTSVDYAIITCFTSPQSANITFYSDALCTTLRVNGSSVMTTPGDTSCGAGTAGAFSAGAILTCFNAPNAASSSGGNSASSSVESFSLISLLFLVAMTAALTLC